MDWTTYLFSFKPTFSKQKCTSHVLFEQQIAAVKQVKATAKKLKSAWKIYKAKAELESMRKGMFGLNSKHVTSSYISFLLFSLFNAFESFRGMTCGYLAGRPCALS